jgi:YD repeat-containing protein
MGFMNKYVLISLLNFLLVKSFAQINGPSDYTIDNFPKPPDAAAMSKFIDIPAGNYTGVGDFSIPLYTINFDGQNIPIELRYSTSGVKVGDIASRVGLGWVLNVGPSLSQQVMGEYDKSFKKTVLPSNFDIPSNCAEYDPNNPNDPCSIAYYSTGILTNSKDIKPDIFSYSTINSSGQFIMDSSGDFGIPRPFNMTKINPIIHQSGYTLGFDIIDDSGYKNNFLARHGVISNFSSCNNQPDEDLGAPNYYLNSITSPNNNKIQYTYNKIVSYKYISSLTEQRLIDKQQSIPIEPYSGIPKFCRNYSIAFQDQALTQISFNEGNVFIYYNNDSEGFVENLRQDLYYDNIKSDVYVTRLVVKNNFNEVIKDFTFQYDYFESIENIPSILPVPSELHNNLKKRLKLLKVIDNLSLGEYKFSYYGDENNIKLPHRLSFSQDFWGVYNGKNNNSTSLPTTKYHTFTDNRIRVFLGANKQPDINYGRIGNLHKIQYPTGGYTEITYEADTYLKKNYEPNIVKYELQDPDVFVNEVDPVQYFTIPNNTFNQKLLFYGTQGNPTHDGRCLWKLSYFNPLIEEYELVESGHSTIIYDEDDVPNYSYFNPGNYKMEIIPNSQNPNEGCYATFNWLNEIIVDDSDTRNAGTIRINKIESIAEDNKKIIREYTYFDKNGKTSGRNLGEELFVPLSSKIIPLGVKDPYGTKGNVKILTLSNNPGWQTNTVRGKAIGYNYVQEKYISSISNDSFYKEYKFKNYDEDPWVQHNPYSTNNITWQPISGLDRGFLEEEVFFNENKRIKKVQYEYVNDNHFNQYSSMNPNPAPFYTNELSLGLEIYIKEINKAPIQSLSYIFDGVTFPIENIWIKNTKIISTEYDNNENPTIVIVDSMEYTPSNKHIFLSKRITENSLGEIIKTEYKYPLDLPNEPNSDKLISTNRISTPLQVTNKNGSIVISDQKTRYKEFIVNNNPIEKLVLPEFVYAKRGELDTNPQIADRKITYIKYDKYGNLQHYKLENGLDVSIIWGYNGQYPIAKVEGIPFSAIESEAIILAGITNLSETSFDTLKSMVNSNTSGGMLTCYLYKPLVGVTTIIQPNGQKETYHYDDAGRLEFVKDHNGNILKQFDYQYKP